MDLDHNRDLTCVKTHQVADGVDAEQLHEPPDEVLIELLPVVAFHHLEDAIGRERLLIRALRTHVADDDFLADDAHCDCRLVIQELRKRLVQAFEGWHVRFGRPDFQPGTRVNQYPRAEVTDQNRNRFAVVSVTWITKKACSGVGISFDDHG